MGKGKNHKGGRKQFTNFEEIEKEKEREEKAKAWRARKGDGGDESEEESKSDEESNDSSSSEAEESEDDKPKAGVQSLIEVNNPNRVVKKANKNVDLNAADGAGVQLSRREREELSKQQAKENYARLTAEGKTEQARADLARLAIIKQQREEAAKRKEEERVAKEAAKAQAAAGKFAGVKSVSATVTAPSGSTKTTKGKRK